MQVKYILTIIGISLFLICFLIFIVLTSRNRKREAALWEGLESMYSDKNLALMSYDFAVYDAELERLLNKRQSGDGQLTIDDLMGSDGAVNYDSIFKSVDSEGLEEITGNYIPEDNSQ